MKVGSELSFEWEKDLKPYVSKDKIEKLRRLVKDKRRKGQIIKWLVIIGDVLFVMLLLVFVGILNILDKGIDLRNSLITGVIAFELAIVTFFSPIKSSSITREEVNKIISVQVTADIIEKIRRTVEQKGSGLEKWLAVIGACGVFVAVILKLIN